jgi:transglutaminase-like putative cysteine protease
MRKLTVSIILCFMFLFYLSGQTVPGAGTIKTTDPYVSKLAALETARKFQFPKYFAKKAVYTYSFQLNRIADPAQLEISEYVNLDLVGAENGAVFKNAVFFDDQSTIKSVRVSDNEHREIPTEVWYGNYQNENIFHDDIKLGVFDVEFNSQGSERTVEYKKIYRDYKYLSRLSFQNEYPSLETEIRIEVPVWLNIEFQKFNFEKSGIEEREEKKYTLDGIEEYTTHIFTAKNVTRLNTEKNSPSTETVYPHLYIIFKSFSDQGKNLDLLKDVQGLYNWCNGLCKKVDNDTAVLKETVAQLIAGKNSHREKIESIYFWVQDKIRYIAFEEGIMGYKPASADKVYTQLYGDCKGMANLLKNMLQLAGYDARLTWIGTREIPYKELFPTLGVFNHMICCVIIDGKKYFLDGTEDFIGLDEYAFRLQGKTVMIEDIDKFITDVIPVSDYRSNLQQAKINLKVNGNKLTGEKTTIYNGEEKLNFLAGYSGIKSEDKEKSIKNYLTYNDKNIRIQNLKHSDLSDRKNPVTVSYDLEIDNYVYKTATELFVYVDFDKEYESYIFDSLRFNDWEMGHRVFVSGETTLEIPQGYELNAPLKNYKQETEDYVVNLNFSREGNTIKYSREFIFKNAIIRKQDFKKWNEINSNLRNVYNTPLVFRKKNA